MLSVCLHIAPINLLNNSTTLYETWYVYHGTRAHLDGVLHKFFPSFCVSVYESPIVARQRLGKNIATATNTHAAIEEVFKTSFSVLFVLPRTSYLALFFLVI
jgi:hypothetical protein